MAATMQFVVGVKETFVQLTTADVTALRVQNLSGGGVYLQATATSTPPTNDAAGKAGWWRLNAGATLAADFTLAQLFPGVTSAARVWVYSLIGGETLSVSHA